MRVDHIEWNRKGILIQVPNSAGKGREVSILNGVNRQTCPILALKNWLQVAQIDSGRVFRKVGRYGSIGESLRGDSIGWIIKDLARKGNLEDPQAYSGHSLRAGFVTEAHLKGANATEIMAQTGHRTFRGVERNMHETSEAELDPVACKLGL